MMMRSLCDTRVVNGDIVELLQFGLFNLSFLFEIRA
jgi:hypothetical protein